MSHLATSAGAENLAHQVAPAPPISDAVGELAGLNDPPGRGQDEGGRQNFPVPRDRERPNRARSPQRGRGSPIELIVLIIVPEEQRRRGVGVVGRPHGNDRGVVLHHVLFGHAPPAHGNPEAFQPLGLRARGSVHRGLELAGPAVTARQPGRGSRGGRRRAVVVG